MLQYCELQPSPPLARFVRCYWVLEGSHTDHEPLERILPDGCMELLIHHGDRFHRHLDGSAAPQPQAFVIGDVDRAVCVEASGAVGVFGARFRPGGLYRFLDRSPANELHLATVELSRLFGASGRSLEAAVAEAHCDAERVRFIEEFLLGRLSPDRECDRLVEAAVSLVETSGGTLSVDAITAKLAINPRRLQRLFTTHVGISAKRLSRVVRFQSVFRSLERIPDLGYAGLALAAGFFDQAHLIRDFRAFAGESPAAYLARRHPLAECFQGGLGTGADLRTEHRCANATPLNR